MHASRRPQHRVERGGESLPAFDFSPQRTAAGRRDPVVASLAVVVGNPPFARNQAVFLKTLKGRIERALIHRELPVGHLLHPLTDAPAVHRRQRERLQDEEIERAAQGIDGWTWWHLSLSREACINASVAVKRRRLGCGGPATKHVAQWLPNTSFQTRLRNQQKRAALHRQRGSESVG